METNTSHNYLEEILNLFKIIEFKEELNKDGLYCYTKRRTIEVKEYNHSSDLEWYVAFEDDKTPTRENIILTLRVSIYNSRDTVNMPIKNFINYLKDEFKYDLRNYKVNKLLHDAS